MGISLLQTVSGNGTSPNLDFTSIPAGFNALQLLVIGRSSSAAANDVTTIRVNNDSGTSYDWVSLRGVNGTATSANSATGDTSISCNFVTADSAPASYCSSIFLDLPFYTATTFNKVLRVTNHTLTAQTAAGPNVLEFSGFWRSTAAVTRLTVILAAGNWKTGSTGLLYGVA